MKEKLGTLIYVIFIKPIFDVVGLFVRLCGGIVDMIYKHFLTDKWKHI